MKIKKKHVPHVPISLEETEKVIKLFHAEKNNTTKNISNLSGISITRVDSILDKYLKK